MLCSSKVSPSRGDHSIARISGTSRPRRRSSTRPSWFERFNNAFNAGYLRMRIHYTGLLSRFIEYRRSALIACACVMASAFLLLPFIGKDFFPAVDTGQFHQHAAQIEQHHPYLFHPE